MYAELKRTCSKCGVEKELTEFLTEGRKAYRRKSLSCRTCNNKRSTRYHKENPEKIRDNDLQKKFGISLEDYQKKLIAQDFKCAICNEEEKILRKGKPIQLAVDHCHMTNQVRDLLCKRCNITLGALEENSSLLHKMIKYIGKFKK